MTEMFKFIVTTKHDKGVAHINLVATSINSAIQMVMKAERCPERAIINVERLNDKHKS